MGILHNGGYIRHAITIIILYRSTMTKHPLISVLGLLAIELPLTEGVLPGPIAPAPTPFDPVGSDSGSSALLNA